MLAYWLYSHGYQSLNRVPKEFLIEDNIPDNLLDADLRVFNIGIHQGKYTDRYYAWHHRVFNFREYVRYRSARSDSESSRQDTELRESSPPEAALRRQQTPPGNVSPRGEACSPMAGVSCGLRAVSTQEASHVSKPRRPLSHVSSTPSPMPPSPSPAGPPRHKGLRQQAKFLIGQGPGARSEGEDEGDVKRYQTCADTGAPTARANEEQARAVLEEQARAVLNLVPVTPGPDVSRPEPSDPQERRRSYTPGMTDAELADMVDEAVRLLSGSKGSKPEKIHKARLQEIQMTCLEFQLNSPDATAFFQAARQSQSQEEASLCILYAGPYHAGLPGEKRAPIKPFSQAASRNSIDKTLINHLKKHKQAESVQAKALYATIHNIPWLRKSTP